MLGSFYMIKMNIAHFYLFFRVLITVAACKKMMIQLLAGNKATCGVFEPIMRLLCSNIAFARIIERQTKCKPYLKDRN